MLTYALDQRGSLSLYEYLYRCIKADIERGTLPADSRLPSKRTFASHLGVSLITVESAYAQLEAEGYLYTKPRRGYYVMPLPNYPEVVASEAAHTVQTFPPLPVGHADSHTAPQYDFSRPAPGVDRRVQHLWSKALHDTLVEEPAEAHLQELPPAGSPRLRNAIAAHLHNLRGMNVDPACILIGSGAQTLYNLIVQLLGRDAGYAIEDPGYPKLASIYRAAGACITPIPLDVQGMQASLLAESGAHVAHIMPSHQFPTGIVTTIARRYELLAWASQQHGRYLIEDDYDCEFRLAGRPIPALQSIDRENKVIYTNTFSKSLGSDMRVAYAILPAPLMRTFTQKLGFYSNTVNAIVQNALAHLIETGAFERHINRVRTSHKAQRDALLAALDQSRYSAHLHPEHQDAGLHFILRVDLPVSEEALVEEAAHNGVGLAALNCYHQQPSERSQRAHKSKTEAGIRRSARNAMPARFVMHYSGMAPSDFPEAIARIDAAIEKCLAS